MICYIFHAMIPPAGKRICILKLASCRELHREKIKEFFDMDYGTLALQAHSEWNGKLDIRSKSPIKDRDALSVAYTPGVAEPCKVIAQDQTKAYQYTMKANTVAVVSDGSAVPLRRCRLWRENALFLKNSAISTPCRSVWIRRIRKKS